MFALTTVLEEILSVPLDLKSGEPYSKVRNGAPPQYPTLEDSQDADVCIIGAGITGTMLARAAVREGRSCILLDRRNVAAGSTMASTCLLQYEIDTHLVDLADMVGEEAAVLAYRSTEQSLQRAERLCREQHAGDFQKRTSFYFASTPEDLPDVRREYEFRRRMGFDIEWLGAGDIAARFDLKSPGGILSQAAQMDAYPLAMAIAAEISGAGGRIYGGTSVESLIETPRGVVVQTISGHEIRCRLAVVAGGYESLSLLKARPKVDINSTYAFVTTPLSRQDGWPDQCLLWESARPYIYARQTADGCGILGGEDIDSHDEETRDRMLPEKTAKLAARWRELFPRIPLEIATAWTGTFAETADGLPYIGCPAEQPGVFFALCYGGNGIMYSLIAAEMLAAKLRGEPHPCEGIFRFGR